MPTSHLFAVNDIGASRRISKLSLRYHPYKQCMSAGDMDHPQRVAVGPAHPALTVHQSAGGVGKEPPPLPPTCKTLRCLEKSFGLTGAANSTGRRSQLPPPPLPPTLEVPPPPQFVHMPLICCCLRIAVAKMVMRARGVPLTKSEVNLIRWGEGGYDDGGGGMTMDKMTTLMTVFPFFSHPTMRIAGLTLK